MMEGRMTLQQAIDHTWEVYQKQVLRRAWSKLHDVPKAEKENCERCAEEHKQLHEWLYKLKRVAETTSAYQNASIDAEVAMSVIETILEEGEGT